MADEEVTREGMAREEAARESMSREEAARESMTSGEIAQEKIARAIREKLREIEERECVKILYAVESGSRAWGFASPDSDYDVRFIYVRRPEEYLRLDPKRDVIEWQLDEVFDVNGWDIRKALIHFHKSSTTVFEWSRSPVVYWESPWWRQVYEAAEGYFQVKPALYQYYGVAKSTYSQFLLGETVTYKKYFYALRPLLACRYIWEHGCPPPIVFEELMREELPGELRQAVRELVERKKKTLEGDVQTPLPRIQRFIEEELEIWKARAGEKAGEPKKDWQALNQVFFRLMEMWRGSYEVIYQRGY